MDNKLLNDLDFTIRRGDFEKARQMIESLEKQYTPGSEEYGELCYYKLLTHYNATDIHTVKYCILHWNRSSCKYCDEVMKYSNSDRKAKVQYVFMRAGKFHTTSEYIPMAEDALKSKDYESAIKYFKLANEKVKVAETSLTAAKSALKKDDFAMALEYLNYALFDDACYEEYKKVKKYQQIYAKFKSEIGSPQKYAADVLKSSDPAKYHKYAALKNRSGGYTDGPIHFIATLIALVVSVLMFFDLSLDSPALYVVWGIAASVALHKRCMWDFGIIKSIGGTFLLALAPALLTEFTGSMFDAPELGPIITLIATLAEFTPALIRNIKYANNSKAGKQTVALKTTFVEPTLNKARRVIVDKYTPLTDSVTAHRWANTIKL